MRGFLIYVCVGLWIATFSAADDPVCIEPFNAVGGSCLYVPLGEKLTWSAARGFCQALGSDLAVFEDANHYEHTLNYIWSLHIDTLHIPLWIGGSDEAVEDRWVWINSKLMPRRSPYWGSNNNFVGEPSGGRRENCAGLFHQDNYYVHDFICSNEHAPLCQKKPEGLRACSLHTGSCSSPFVNVNGQCLLFITEHADWDQARVQCQRWPNADLAILDDIKQVAIYMNNNGFRGNWWHVGANNRNDTSKHTWIDGNDVAPGDWEPQPGEPSLVGNNQCVHLHPTKHGYGVLADNLCTISLPTICLRQSP